MVEITERPRRKVGFGAAFLTLGGLASAIGLASCCALPMLLAGAGLSAAWLGGFAILAAPHRALLLVVGTACLLGGAGLLWRQQREAATYRSGGVCTPAPVRMAILIGLLVAGGLLWAGYRYA